MRTSGKFFCLLCAICLVSISVVTIGGQEKAVAESKGIVFYLSPNQFDEFQTTALAMLKKYVEKAGYEYRALVAGNEDLALQLNQLDNALTQNPKAIILAAVNAAGIVDGVEKARKAGVPVIAFDRIITDTKVDFSSVASCKRMGNMAAQSIADLLKKKNGDVKGLVLDIMGDPGDSYTVLIEEGFQETMKQYPNVKIDTKIADKWEATNAANIADDYLVAHPETDLIFAHSDHLTAAIASVLETKGIKQGEKLLASCTGMPMGLDLIRKGWAQVVVEQPLAAQAEAVAVFLDDIIAKKELKPGKYTVGGLESELVVQPYGPEIRIPGTAITKENVDEPRFWGNQVGK
jgi:ribose transport system substrate-binding protein